MMSRLLNVPVYSTRETQVPAIYFNHVKLTLLRFCNVVRFPLPGFQHIDVVIDADSWVCVDASLNDMPMVAWMDFDVRGRDNLYQPIRCTQNYYHFMAGIIAKNALQLIDDQLQCQLEELFQHENTTTEKRHVKTTRKHLSVV